jgi:hypothetical protein
MTVTVYVTSSVSRPLIFLVTTWLVVFRRTFMDWLSHRSM